MSTTTTTLCDFCRKEIATKGMPVDTPSHLRPVRVQLLSWGFYLPRAEFCNTRCLREFVNAPPCEKPKPKFKKKKTPVYRSGAKK